MIDIKELRRLAQAALVAPDGLSAEWMDRLGQFQEYVSPAAITELLDRLEAAESTWKEVDKSCWDLTEKVIPNIREQLESAEEERDRYWRAYSEWIAKTEWVQEEIGSGALPAKYLGMHRADAIKLEIDRLRAKIAEMEKQK